MASAAAAGAVPALPWAQTQGQHQEEVFLVVYDLSHYNQYLGCLGLGIYHTGVSVYGKEFMYGGHDKEESGCFQCKPSMAPPPATFREMIPVGYTCMNEFEVMVEVINMGNGRFRGNKYHLLEHNCNHFSLELVQLLTNGSRPLPRISWINRAAAAAKSCSCLLPVPDELLTPARTEEQAGAPPPGGAAPAPDAPPAQAMPPRSPSAIRGAPVHPQSMQLPPSPSRAAEPQQGAPAAAASPGKRKAKPSSSPISLGSARAKAYRYQRDDS